MMKPEPPRDLLALVVIVRRRGCRRRLPGRCRWPRVGEEELERIDRRTALLSAEIAGLDDLGRRDRDDRGHDARGDVGERRDGDRGDRLPLEVVWMAADWACDGRIMPRSALMRTPNATEAMMIAIVDRMRLVVGFMTVAAPLMR